MAFLIWMDSINVESTELLQYVISNGMIDLAYVQEQINMNKRKEILKEHQYEIWLGNDDFWRTYIPDITKKSKRRLIKKKSLTDLEDEVIHYLRVGKTEQQRSTVTLMTLFPEWIDYKAIHTNSTSYIKKITAEWSKYYSIQTDFINMPLIQFTKIQLDNWAHNMIKTYEMSKKQYYNMSIILRQELDYAVEKGFIEKNVFEDVKINTKMFRRVKKKSGATQVYMTDEIPKMINDMARRFANDPSNTAPLAVMLDFETGIRIGELLALRKSDISPDGCYLHIQRQVVRDFKRVDDNCFKMKFCGFKVVEYTKSDDGDREVYLTELARKILWLVFMTNEKYNHHCEDFIFVNGNKRINHYAIQARVLRGCESIGIITKTMHKIRKTYISTLIDSGLNIDEIRKQAGHSDERTTYGNYCYNRMTQKETEKTIEDALSCERYNVINLEKVIKSNQNLLVDKS